ncbi:MAG: hypothetical protein NVSMB29_13640 [Candidatus Dormibacteria bacterium]
MSTTYLQGNPGTLRAARALVATQEFVLALLAAVVFFTADSTLLFIPCLLGLIALVLAGGRLRGMRREGMLAVLVVEAVLLAGTAVAAARGGPALAAVTALLSIAVAVLVVLPPSLRAFRPVEYHREQPPTIPTPAAGGSAPLTSLDVLAEEARVLEADRDLEGRGALAPPPAAEAELRRRAMPAGAALALGLIGLLAVLLAVVMVKDSLSAAPGGLFAYSGGVALVSLAVLALLLGLLAYNLRHLSSGVRTAALVALALTVAVTAALDLHDHHLRAPTLAAAAVLLLAAGGLLGDPRAREAFRLGPYLQPPAVELPADVLYEIRDLRKHYPVKGGFLGNTVAEVQAVTDVTFTIRRGETLGLVGESGCGKTTMGRLLLRLIEPTAGQLLYEGRDLRSLPYNEMKQLRSKMSIIFQDPYASLNPRLPIGDIIGEGLYNAGMRSAAEREKRVAAMLERVGLRKYYINRYPHEFSGGQRQRIGIARALVTEPTFVVADEPVSALDVSIQSQVLNLLKDLQDEFKLTLVFISHNLQVVQHVSDRVGVMYLGKLVELASAQELYSTPKHPYTQALLSAIPLPDPTRRRERILIRGDVPSAINPPPGCRFHTRCPLAQEICARQEPALEPKGGAAIHLAACHFSDTAVAEEMAAKAAVSTA